MKFEKSVKKVFTNKYFLYFLLFLSVTNLLGYLMMKNFNAIAIFLVVGLLVYYFSKNMSVILLVSLVVTNLLMSRKFFKEGMTGSTEESGSTDTTTSSSTSTDEKKKIVATPTNASSTSGTTNSPITGPPPSQDEEAAIDPNTLSTLVNTEAAAGASEGMTNSKVGHKLDYAATVTEAYKGLNDLLDPDAIKNLTQETMTLMQEQQKLYKSMEAMSPLISQAKGLIEGMDINGLKGIGEMVTKFTKTNA
jgi:hypothetical protein